MGEYWKECLKCDEGDIPYNADHTPKGPCPSCGHLPIFRECGVCDKPYDTEEKRRRCGHTSDDEAEGQVTSFHEESEELALMTWAGAQEDLRRVVDAAVREEIGSEGSLNREWMLRWTSAARKRLLSRIDELLKEAVDNYVGKAP